MSSRADLPDWVLEALTSLGGSGSVVDVCKQVWARHEGDLRDSGDLFFTWQYDVRWAATKLRKKGLLSAAEAGVHGVWSLARTNLGR